MEPKAEKLKCPKCGKEHTTYKDYFKCWTSHLSATAMKPLTHSELIRHYYLNPQAFEKGMASVGCEVGVFRGRIDLILRDREGRLCLVDITTGKNIDRKVEQLDRYRKNLKWLANQVFKTKLPWPIRIFVVHPTKGIQELTEGMTHKVRK